MIAQPSEGQPKNWHCCRSQLWSDNSYGGMHLQAEVLREAALAGDAAASEFLCTKTESPVMEPIANHPDLRGAQYAAMSARGAGCNASSSEPFQ